MSHRRSAWRRDVRWLLTDDPMLALITYKDHKLGHIRYNGDGSWAYRSLGGPWHSPFRTKWHAARRLVQAFTEFEERVSA